MRALVDLGSAVLLVTHNVLEAERAVDRLAIINKGKVVGTGTPPRSRATTGESMRLELVLEPRAEVPELPAFLDEPGGDRPPRHGPHAERDVAPAVQWSARSSEQGAAEEYAVGPITLEDVYLAAVGREDAPPSTAEEVAL